MNVITSALTDFRHNFLSTFVWLAGAAFALTGHSSYLQVLAIIFLAFPLVRSYWSTLRLSFMPSRFVTLQTKAIEKAVAGDFALSLVEIGPDLKNAKVKKFNQAQLQQFLQKVQTAIIANRFLYTWGYQLDQYHPQGMHRPDEFEDDGAHGQYLVCTRSPEPSVEWYALS